MLTKSWKFSGLHMAVVLCMLPMSSSRNKNGMASLSTGYGRSCSVSRLLYRLWHRGTVSGVSWSGLAAMIWPSSLVNAAMFYTLHDHSRSDPTRTNGWSIGRYRWFLIVFTGAFLWYWFPGWIFRGLSWFCWITWIWPDSVIVNQLFEARVAMKSPMPITFVSFPSRLILFFPRAKPS